MPALNPIVSPSTELHAVKTRQQAAWSTGDYAVVGTTLQIVGESLCEALDLHSDAQDKTLGRYAPPAQGVRSPALWGTKARLEELFRTTAREIRSNRREFNFRYRSPAHWIDVFRTYYGPVNKTFSALNAEDQAALTLDLLALMSSLNQSRDRTLVVPSEYLEVVICRN